jgi:glutamine synthetase
VYPSGWDIHDTVYSRELLISNKANGYRDILASIDISTYRRIPWENNVPFFLVSFFDPDTKEPLSVDPRGLLKNANDSAKSLGYEAYAGCEYEVPTQLCLLLKGTLTPRHSTLTSEV